MTNFVPSASRIGFRKRFQTLAAKAVLAVAIVAAMTGVTLADDTMPSAPFKFDLNPFAASKPAHKVKHHLTHTVKKAVPAEIKSEEPTASAPVPDIAPAAAPVPVESAAPAVSAGPPLAPPTAVEVQPVEPAPAMVLPKADVEAVEKSRSLDIDGVMATVSDQAMQGVDEVKKRTGGGWHLPLALFLIIVGTVGVFRYLAVKVYKGLRPAWNLFWNAVKKTAAIAWVLLTKAGAFLKAWTIDKALPAVKAFFVALWARFEAWRAARAAKAAAAATTPAATDAAAKTVTP